MDDKRTFILTETNRRHVFNELWNMARVGDSITWQEPTRTLEQNAKLWPMLDDISKQVDWYGKKLTRDDWKDVFTASLVKANVVPNLEGNGFVACGLHTSRMGKKLFSDLIELIYAFGAEKGVVWSEKATKAYEDWLIEQSSRPHRHREVDITPPQQQLQGERHGAVQRVGSDAVGDPKGTGGRNR